MTESATMTSVGINHSVLFICQQKATFLCPGVWQTGCRWFYSGEIDLSICWALRTQSIRYLGELSVDILNTVYLGQTRGYPTVTIHAIKVLSLNTSVSQCLSRCWDHSASCSVFLGWLLVPEAFGFLKKKSFEYFLAFVLLEVLSCISRICTLVRL